MTDERTAHGIVLHLPQSAGLHGILPFHRNGFHRRAEGIGGHIHAWFRTGNVRFHHRIALGQHILFIKRPGTFVGIGIHADVHQPRGRVGRCPEEILPFLVTFDFHRCPKLATEDGIGQV